MKETPTLGQVAYEAYIAGRPWPPNMRHRRWVAIGPAEQRAWDAAAQAAMTAWIASPDGPTPAPAIGDGLVHHVVHVGWWETSCGELHRAHRGTDAWADVTCPACHEHRAVPEPPPYGPMAGTSK